MDLEVGCMEVVATVQADKIVGMGEGAVEGTADTDPLLLDYNRLESVQDSW
jgi:hypothetical protein